MDFVIIYIEFYIEIFLSYEELSRDRHIEDDINVCILYTYTYLHSVYVSCEKDKEKKNVNKIGTIIPFMR